MNYLITGASGFVGGHLIEHIFRTEPCASITCLDLAEPDYYFIGREVSTSLSFVRSDLLSCSDVLSTLESVRPDFIIHLASFSSVAYSWQHPIESFLNNSNIFLNLLEAVRTVNPQIRILSIGSSEQYGNVSPDLVPLKETAPQNPLSPYAVARVAQEHMAAVYARGYKLDIVNTRSFNHFGQRQSERFVLSGFARQIAEIKRGKRPPVLFTGDIDIVRDFIDVRDVVNAYLLLLQKGLKGDIYNVCSGKGRTISDCLQRMIEIAGLKCEIRRAESLVRPADNPIIIGDNTKIRKQTGWAPEVPFEKGLRDIFNYWMSRI